LIFPHASPVTTKRDLGAGRTQAMRSGLPGMDARQAPSGQGCPFGACPRSVAGVREPDEGGPNQEQKRFGYFWSGPASGSSKVTRCKSGTDISLTSDNGYTPKTRVSPKQHQAAKKRHPPCRFHLPQRKSLAAFLASPPPDPLKPPEIKPPAIWHAACYDSVMKIWSTGKGFPT
jgi:hypothetical protein